MGVTAYFAFRSGQISVHSIASELRQETVTRVSQYLKAYLAFPVLINRINVDSIRSGQVGIDNPSQIEEHLFIQLQQFNQVSEILVGDETGRLRIVSRKPSWTLSTSDPIDPKQLQVYAIDQKGHKTKRLRSFEQPKVQQQPWYQAAVTAKRPIFAPIFQLEREADLSLHTSQPIYDQQTGKLLGVASAAADLSQFRQFLASLKIGQRGRLFILERNGLLVGTSTQEAPYTTHQQNGKTQRLRLAAVDSSDALIRATSRHLLAQFDDFRQIQTVQQLKFSRDDEHLLVQVVPYRDSLGLDWLITIVVPETDFTAEVNHHNRITLLFSVSALLGAMALGFLTSAYVARPILRLSRASRAMAIGSWEQPIEENSQIAELEVLARSFNQMTEHLQSSFDQVKIALQESEEKFTKVFRTSPDAITIITLPEGRYLEVNESFLVHNGYTREEVIGRTAWDLNQVVAHKQATEVQRQIQTKGTVRNLEFDYRTKTGQLRTGLLSAEVIELEGHYRLLSIFKDITERKQAEAALQQSEARYLAILEAQTDLIARHTAEGILTFVNEAFCRYFGVRREDVIGKPFNPNVFPADRERVAEILHCIHPNRPVVTLENRVIAQGQVRWTQWVNQAFFDDQGQILEFQSVGRDIDDLKQTEAKLRCSEANLREAQRVAQLGSWEFEVATGNITWTEELFHICGRDPVQWVPNPTSVLEQVIHQDDRTLYSNAIQQALEQGKPYKITVRILRPDGTLRAIEAKGEPIFNELGQVMRLVGTALDLTERQKTEDALQQSEQRFRGAFDAAAIGMAMISVEGHFLEVNVALCNLLGYSEVELLTLTVQQVTHPEDWKIDGKLAQQVLSGQLANYQLEKRYIHQAGHTIWGILSVSLVRDRAHNPLYFVIQIQDITLRKQIEANLQPSYL